jgi:AhpD family alkylhydroperoxidase
VEQADDTAGGALSRIHVPSTTDVKEKHPMTTHAAFYYEKNAAAMKPVREAMPDMLKAFGTLHQTAMKAGSLETATKELIALGIGLAIRCENCIYAHVRSAIQAGATKEQIVEAAEVAVMIGGRARLHLPATGHGSAGRSH